MDDLKCFSYFLGGYSVAVFITFSLLYIVIIGFNYWTQCCEVTVTSDQGSSFTLTHDCGPLIHAWEKADQCFTTVCANDKITPVSKENNHIIGLMSVLIIHTYSYIPLLILSFILYRFPLAPTPRLLLYFLLCKL